eukprot:jgi/Undpi1/4720/HiC_scaffold_18.g08073.m1
MGRSPERRAGGGTITLMYTLVFLGGLTTTLSFSPGTSSPFLGGKSSALRRAQVVPQAVTGATALTAATTRSSTGVWRKGIRNGLRMRGAIRRKRSWGQGMWNKFTSPPAAGRAHDEVTFRSGTLPTSVILHRIKHPLLAQTCWATAVSLVHAASRGMWSMSIKPHTLLGSALGLLLVFRTNAAYQRFQEGRKLWEELLNVSRDIARMSSLYEDTFGPRLVQRVGNLLACHAVILQEHLQGYKLPQVWQDLVRRHEVDELMATTCNRPLKVINKISREIKAVPYSEDWSSRERLAILAMCNKLSATIGGCERLVQTPVPLHYVRHTSRFLTIWCFLLPLVIVGEMGMATAPVVCLATWALFGIQEIGLLIEDPFQSALSLEIMCNTVYSDVMQTIGATDPTLPQQPIPMQSGITVSDVSHLDIDEVLPLSARCRHPALKTSTDGVVATR